MEQSHASYIKGKIESQQSKLLILVIFTDGLWMVSAKMDGKCIKKTLVTILHISGKQ